ncbi:tumor necrosis factor receptor superfamily member 11B [Rhinophrynus dorsalis]
MYKIISCTLMVLVNMSFSSEDYAPKYSHYDPITSLHLLCDQCPPGTYVKQDCTEDENTKCAPCPFHHFTDRWSSNKECYFCSTVCKELQYVKQECNSTHHRVCECMEGHYLELEFCLPHTKCSPGFGVVQLGTPESDTVCERCSKGLFSNEASSTATCQKHTDCKKLGLKVAQKGNAEHDSECQPSTEESTPYCEIDITLCEEALFRSTTDLPATLLVQRLPGTVITSQQMEWIKQKQDPQEQAFQIFKLWKNQNQDLVRHLLKDIDLCEKGVLKHIGHLNMSMKHLTDLMQSLPGKKIGKEDIENIMKLCDRPRQILKLLSLWRIKNGKNTIKSLNLLKTKQLPKKLRRRMKKLEQFLNSVYEEKMEQKKKEDGEEEHRRRRIDEDGK